MNSVSGSSKEIELSNRFAKLTRQLLSQSQANRVLKSASKMPKSMGMSFRISSLAVEPMYNPPEVLLDLADIASGLSFKNPDLVREFKELRREAEETVTESSLISRYADYQDAIMGLSTASEMIKDISEKIDAEMAATRSKGWIDRIKGLLNRVREIVGAAFARIFRGVESLYNGLALFYTQIKNLMQNVTKKIKEKIIESLHRVINSLAALSVRVVSTFFAWLSSVKRIASKHGFTLQTITVKLNPITIEKVTVFGFSIPIPKIPMPEVSMNFK